MLTSKGCTVVLVEYPVHIPPNQTRLACWSGVGGARVKGHHISHHGGRRTRADKVCSMYSACGRGGEGEGEGNGNDDG